jgi:hypothetical protein
MRARVDDDVNLSGLPIARQHGVLLGRVKTRARGNLITPSLYRAPDDGHGSGESPSIPRVGPLAASRETVSWRTAACQPPGVIQELRWLHGGHGDCASARAGYGVRRWVSVGPRPAGARGGGAICCVAAPAEALSHWDDRLADTRTDRRTRKKRLRRPNLSGCARAIFTRAVR